jgi:hypothetical protein
MLPKIELSRDKPFSNPAPKSSRNVALELCGNRSYDLSPRRPLPLLSSPALPYGRQAISCGLSSFRSLLRTCAFVQINYVWASGAKLGFGHVRQQGNPGYRKSRYELYLMYKCVARSSAGILYYVVFELLVCGFSMFVALFN